QLENSQTPRPILQGDGGLVPGHDSSTEGLVGILHDQVPAQGDLRNGVLLRPTPVAREYVMAVSAGSLGCHGRAVYWCGTCGARTWGARRVHGKRRHVRQCAQWSAHRPGLRPGIESALRNMECQEVARMLDERKLAVLRAVVEDFVRTNEPVGSRALADRHQLGVSPATIRND